MRDLLAELPQVWGAWFLLGPCLVDFGRCLVDVLSMLVRDLLAELPQVVGALGGCLLMFFDVLSICWCATCSPSCRRWVARIHFSQLFGRFCSRFDPFRSIFQSMFCRYWCATCSPSCRRCGTLGACLIDLSIDILVDDLSMFWSMICRCLVDFRSMFGRCLVHAGARSACRVAAGGSLGPCWSMYVDLWSIFGSCWLALARSFIG